MKISQEDYEDLKYAILQCRMAQNQDMHARYERLFWSDEKYRWDLLWMSGVDVNILYKKGLNDDHIDTALRKILGHRLKIRRKQKFGIGDQIVYIPSHANDIFHKDAEFGFITGFNSKGDAFCRYWRNPDKNELRTKANSECTPVSLLQKYDLKPQKLITQILIDLGYVEKF